MDVGDVSSSHNVRIVRTSNHHGDSHRHQGGQVKVLAVFVLLVIFATLAAAQTVSGTATLSANATDATSVVGDTECGVAFVQFFNGTVPLSPQITTPVSGTTYTFVWDTKSVSNGTYTLTAKATDKAGLNGLCDSTKVNVGVSNALTVVVNNIPPDIATPTVSITVTVP